MSMEKVSTMKFWHFDESGCVDHYIVAEDATQARGVMVGMAMNMGTCEEMAEHEWTIREVDRAEMMAWETWWNDEVFGGPRRPVEMMDEQAAKGPGYVACSEY
jgi:hypothetical protein